MVDQVRGVRELLGGWRGERRTTRGMEGREVRGDQVRGGPGERATRGMEGRVVDQVRGVRELLGGWRGEWWTR